MGGLGLEIIHKPRNNLIIQATIFNNQLRMVDRAILITQLSDQS